MDYRIGIVGCAGTGKSALARALSSELDIPALESKAVTQDILDRDGYDYASGIQIERFLANTGRQNEILRRTMEQEDATESFVTDRTVADLAAYVLCEMHDSDTKVVREILKTCRSRISRYTHLFLCPWRDERVTGNQKRTLNPFYQLLIHSVEIGILDLWAAPYRIVECEGIEGRVQAIMAELKRANPMRGM